MAVFTIPKNREKLLKKVPLVIAAFIAVFFLYRTIDYRLNLNNSLTPVPHVKEYISGVDGHRYRKVTYPKYTGPKEKATFVTLVRNSDLYNLLEAIKSVEDRFNHKFQYDWVFLNDEPFTEEFKVTVSALISGKTKFGLVPVEHWSYPAWIDQEKAAEAREEMTKNNVIYGWSESYRHMCRFESGFFFSGPLDG